MVQRDAATAQQARRVLPVTMPPATRLSDGVGETVLSSPLDHHLQELGKQLQP